jgi:hypothetical protein
MPDVFVGPVLVLAVKLGAIVDVGTRYGLYAFAASVLLTMFIATRVVSLAGRPGPHGIDPGTDRRHEDRYSLFAVLP